MEHRTPFRAWAPDRSTPMGTPNLPDFEDLTSRRDRLLFDRLWLTPDEVASHHRRLKWGSLCVVLETLVVTLLLLGLARSLYGILQLFLV